MHWGNYLILFFQRDGSNNFFYFREDLFQQSADHKKSMEYKISKEPEPKLHDKKKQGPNHYRSHQLFYTKRYNKLML